MFEVVSMIFFIGSYSLVDGKAVLVLNVFFFLQAATGYFLKSHTGLYLAAFMGQTKVPVPQWIVWIYQWPDCPGSRLAEKRWAFTHMCTLLRQISFKWVCLAFDVCDRALSSSELV